MERIGLGGGCHWCTEAVFQSLIGVAKVEQGFISPRGNDSSFSEAIIVHYDSSQIGLKDLIEIHLYTHKSTSDHSMRNKYRSAVYVFDAETMTKSESILKELQKEFEIPLITSVLYFGKFKPSNVQFQDYYYNNPEKPFCETYIAPKLRLLLNKFSRFVHQKTSNMFREST